MLRLVAARHAGVLDISHLAADAQLPRTTVLRYLDVLEAVFLTVRIPAWAANLSQREIRAPKVFVTDSGLAAHLRRAEIETMVRPELARGADGPIMEGFVLTELLRQASAAADPHRSLTTATATAPRSTSSSRRRTAGSRRSR